MTLNPRIITAPNGRKYFCFFTAAYAYKWARAKPEFQHCMPVRIGNMTGFGV